MLWAELQGERGHLQFKYQQRLQLLLVYHSSTLTSRSETCLCSPELMSGHTQCLVLANVLCISSISVTLEHFKLKLEED